MRMWQDWTNGFLGVWLILLATLNVTNSWTILATGALVAAMGFWGVVRERSEEEEHPYRHDFGLYAD